VAAGKNIIVCGILVFSLGMFLSCGYRPETMADIGKPAPSFKLFDLDGQEVSLEKFYGKIILLDFWATWCTPCRMTMPVVERLSKEYSDDMVVIAINMQEPKDAVEKYAFEQAVSSLILLDKEGAVSSAYGAYAIPMQFIIDRSGIVRHIQTGYSSNMASQMRAQIEQLRQVAPAQPVNFGL
jgi:thiol-disulfide isomerase/thioredoxin